MWACYCFYCTDNVLCYTTRKPTYGVQIFYGDYFHKDFSPVENIFDEPKCDQCRVVYSFIEVINTRYGYIGKVFDFTRLA